MNRNIVEAYVVTLIEQIMTGDTDGWTAIKKFENFIADVSKTTKIVYKENANE